MVIILYKLNTAVGYHLAIDNQRIALISDCNAWGKEYAWKTKNCSYASADSRSIYREAWTWFRFSKTKMSRAFDSTKTTTVAVGETDRAGSRKSGIYCEFNEDERSNTAKKQPMTAYKKRISQNKEPEYSRFTAKDFGHNTRKTISSSVISNKVSVLEAPALIMSSNSNRFCLFTQHNKDDNIEIDSESVGSNNVLTRSGRSGKSTSSVSIPQAQGSKNFGSESKGERNYFDNPESYSCAERKRKYTPSQTQSSMIPKYKQGVLQRSSQCISQSETKRLKLNSEQMKTVSNSRILKPITLQNSTELCETKVQATRPATTATICNSVLRHKFKSVTRKGLEDCNVSKNNLTRSESTELRTTNGKLSNDSFSAEKCVMNKVTYNMLNTGEKASVVPLKISRNFHSSVVESDSFPYAKTESFTVTEVDDKSCVSNFGNIGNETTKIKFSANSSINPSSSEKSNVFSKSSSLQGNVKSDIGGNSAVPTQVSVMCNTTMPKPGTYTYPVDHLKVALKKHATPNYESSSLLNLVSTHSTLQDTSLFVIEGCKPHLARNPVTVATQTDFNEPSILRSGIDIGFINTTLERVFSLCQSHQEQINEINQRHQEQINAIIQKQSNIIYNEISDILSVIGEKENNSLHNLILQQKNQSLKLQQNNKDSASKTFNNSVSSTPLRRSLRIAAQKITLTPNTIYETPVGSHSKRTANLENSSNAELQKSQTEYRQLRYSFHFLKTPQISKQSSKKANILRTSRNTPNQALSQRIHDQLQSLYD